eukprot:UN3562
MHLGSDSDLRVQLPLCFVLTPVASTTASVSLPFRDLVRPVTRRQNVSGLDDAARVADLRFGVGEAPEAEAVRVEPPWPSLLPPHGLRFQHACKPVQPSHPHRKEVQESGGVWAAGGCAPAQERKGEHRRSRRPRGSPCSPWNLSDSQGP